MHVSLETMTSYTRRCKGDIPPPLVGATATYISLSLPARNDECAASHPNNSDRAQGATRRHDRVYVFGGRRVGSRQVVASMYVLDLETRIWRRVDPWADEASLSKETETETESHWPPARYFHTVDAVDGKLLLFGGMGHRQRSDGEAAEGNVVPCVLDDVHIYDCLTGRWSDGLRRTAEEGASVEQQRPMARYAHLSAVSSGKLYVMGGQDIRNEYITETAVYDIARREWVGSWLTNEPPRGSYRSVAVPAKYRVSSDEQRGPPLATPEDGGGREIYLFSNSNFTDVRRELQVLIPAADTSSDKGFASRDITAQMHGFPLPPGLRFPFGTILGHHLVLAGTYLSASVQTFAVWALDLRTYMWRRLDALALDGPGQPVARGDGRPGGSWNKAICWEDRNRLVVFGNKHSDLQQDYEHRAINFDHMAIVELEIFGIYRIPLQPPVSAVAQDQLLRTLSSGKIADFALVTDDGRMLPCSRKMLEHRWPWLRRELTSFTFEALAIVEEARQAGAKDGEVVHVDALPITLSVTHLTPRTLHISESYPVCLALLQYLYARQLITPLQNQPPVLFGLLSVAKQYDLPDLEAAVAHAMHERLADETALGIYEIATLCGCTSLQIRALRMVLLLQKKPKRPSNGHRRSGSEGSLLTAADAQQTPSTGKTNGSIVAATPRSAQDQGRQAEGSAGRQVVATEAAESVSTAEIETARAPEDGSSNLLAPEDNVKTTKRRSWRNSLREAVFPSARDSGSWRAKSANDPSSSHDATEERQPNKLVRGSKSLHNISVSPVKDTAPPLPFAESGSHQSPERQQSMDRRRSDSLRAIHHFVLSDSPPRPAPPKGADDSANHALRSPSLLVDGEISPLLSTAGISSTNTFPSPMTPQTPSIHGDLGWPSVLQPARGSSPDEATDQADLKHNFSQVASAPQILAEWSDETARQRDATQREAESGRPLRIDTAKARGNLQQYHSTESLAPENAIHQRAPLSPLSRSDRSSNASQMSDLHRGTGKNATSASATYLNPSWTPHVLARDRQREKNDCRAKAIAAEFGVARSTYDAEQNVKSTPQGLGRTLRRLWA